VDHLPLVHCRVFIVVHVKGPQRRLRDVDLVPAERRVIEVPAKSDLALALRVDQEEVDGEVVVGDIGLRGSAEEEPLCG